MKTYLLKAAVLLATLPVALAARSQKQIKIEDINTDSLALAFVKQSNYDPESGPQWKFFYLSSGKEWQSYFNFSKEDKAKYWEQQNTFRWLKTDLNLDGKADLVVSGYIAKRPENWATATFKILAFVSQPGSQYAEVNLLTGDDGKYPAYFSQLLINGQRHLLLERWKIGDQIANRPYLRDTVDFSTYWNGFVNYTQRPLRMAEISSIDYKVMEDLEGSYHGLFIDLQTTKKTNMEVRTLSAGEKTPNINRARLAADLWTHLDTLVRGSYVTGRKKGDTTVMHHDFNSQQLATYLTVVYKDGHKEVIQDYGDGGTYSLMNIYSCMEHIIQNVFEQLERREMFLNSMIDGSFDY